MFGLHYFLHIPAFAKSSAARRSATQGLVNDAVTHWPLSVSSHFSANQSRFEHSAAERWLPPWRNPRRRGPGFDPTQISQPYLHVLPGNLLYHLSNTVTLPFQPSAPPPPPRSFPHNMSSPALPSLSAVTLLRHDSGDSETLLEYRKCYDDIDNNK